uniref:Uncharacterized protein n=1 Tax=Anguilla anguilla TaxID=7936 RepID=A0A0E9WFJ8_ANGAN
MLYLAFPHSQWDCHRNVCKICITKNFEIDSRRTCQ